MTTQRPGLAITISLADNGDDLPATVVVTGPDGQWSAALSVSDPNNFTESICSAVRKQVARALQDEWPQGEQP